MKQCISRIIKTIIHLWQTLKEYVCRRRKITIEYVDVDGDDKQEIVIDVHEMTVNQVQINNFEGGISNDRQSDSLLESSRNEEK